MQRLTVIIGAVMILLGIVTFYASGAVHFTALIPAIFGALLLVCALLASKEHLRMHAMHGAATVSLLGILGTISSLGHIGALMNGTSDRPMAIQAKLIMLALSTIYLAFCVRSFIDARRARKSGQA